MGYPPASYHREGEAVVRAGRTNSELKGRHPGQSTESLYLSETSGGTISANTITAKLSDLLAGRLLLCRISRSPYKWCAESGRSKFFNRLDRWCHHHQITRTDVRMRSPIAKIR